MEKRRYISTQSYEDRKQIERARKEINIDLVTCCSNNYVMNPYLLGD